MTATVPDISNSMLEETTDMNEELFFPNYESEKVDKYSSKGNLEFMETLKLFTINNFIVFRVYVPTNDQHFNRCTSV